MKTNIFMRIFLLAVSLSVLSACSGDDGDQSYTYYIGADVVNVSGGAGGLPPMGPADGQYESNFTLSGSEQECDAKAKEKFNAATLILQSVANTITGYSGSITYVLQRDGTKLATKDITFTPNTVQ